MYLLVHCKKIQFIKTLVESEKHHVHKKYMYFEYCLIQR